MKDAALSLMLATLMSVFAGCAKEAEIIPATQVIVTLRSTLAAPLSTIDATVYDVTGQKTGDHSEFDLGVHALPFSFTVVPTVPSTTAFMLVVRGKNGDGNSLVETKAIVHFVARTTIGIELWLSQDCLGEVCGPQETCTELSASEARCGAIPTIEGHPQTPGDELDASTVVEVDPSAAGDADMTGETGGSDANGPTSDAGTSAPLDASGTTTPAAACLGNASQVVCSEAVLNQCNDLGQVEKQETCQSPRQCQLGLAMKTCAPCSPGMRRCTGVRLERCSEDGLKWDLLKSCESEALCNAIAGDCVSGTCTAATRVCMDGGLYGCSQDLTQLTLLKPCAATMCDQLNGECDVCTPSARTCDGTFAEACDSRGQALTRTECTGATPKCTGTGQCVQCTVATDCPAPSNQCQTATCNVTTTRCGTTPRAAHTTCTGGVCNGSGTCVQCVDDSDCRTTGARKCSNARCVACTANTDCPATYECTASQTCQKVSLVGTGTTCPSSGTPSATRCGSYYCGVTPQRLERALDPSARCNLSASLACSGGLTRLAQTCSSMFTADAILNPAGFRSKTIACVKENATAQGWAVSDPCVDCFAQVQLCCAADTLGCATVCSGGASAECDMAMRNVNCVAPLFTCSGLPSPL
jgi:hypothetical protein